MSLDDREELELWAVVEHNRPLQRLRQPLPVPKGTEVLIKVTHCGVCHSDVHLWEGKYTLPLPRALGHEILGTVAALGPEVEGVVPLQSQQVVFPWLGCGMCNHCQEGHNNRCLKPQSLGINLHGGFASHVVVPHPRYLVDVENVDPAFASTLGCSGVTVYNALEKVLPLPSDEPVVLIGAGGLGLLAISMLRALGHRSIISVDISEEKVKVAREAGATATVRSGTETTATDLLAATGGPVLAVVDFVNVPASATLGLDVLRKTGKLVLVGLSGGIMQLNLATMIFKAASIVGTNTGDLYHLQAVARLAKEGKLKPIQMTEAPWEQAGQALEALAQGKVVGRTVLVK